jgi:predicted adenine nucleotide alpha hydrolase (AANH) superfamily ATPase
MIKANQTMENFFYILQAMIAVSVTHFLLTDYSTSAGYLECVQPYERHKKLGKRCHVTTEVPLTNNKVHYIYIITIIQIN